MKKVIEKAANEISCSGSSWTVWVLTKEILFNLAHFQLTRELKRIRNIERETKKLK